MLSRQLLKNVCKFPKGLANNVINVNHSVTRKIHGTKYAASNYHPIASHRDTEDNTAQTFFDFSPENYKRVKNDKTFTFSESFC